MNQGASGLGGIRWSWNIEVEIRDSEGEVIRVVHGRTTGKSIDAIEILGFVQGIALALKWDGEWQ